VPVLAAGGIVLRREQPPRIAVVRLRKRDEWVLPKGKLDEGETPRAAAKREVLEETGHNVTVHEFLGTLVYESGGRSKVVHYWSMEAGDEQTRELMDDIRAVDWLPLSEALVRLSRGSERTFLETVGPLAINGLSRRLKAKAPVAKEAAVKETAVKEPAAKEPAAKPPVARKRRGRVVVTPEPALVEPALVGPVPPPPEPVPATDARASATSEVLAVEPPAEAEIAAPAIEPDFCTEPMNGIDHAAAESVDAQRRSFAERLRDWLGRAA
jgi:8-oxo-dGTP diphosphatase